MPSLSTAFVFFNQRIRFLKRLMNERKNKHTVAIRGGLDRKYPPRITRIARIARIARNLPKVPRVLD